MTCLSARLAHMPGKQPLASSRNYTSVRCYVWLAGSMQHRFEKLGQYLRGWMGYFGISEYYQPISELDDGYVDS